MSGNWYTPSPSHNKQAYKFLCQTNKGKCVFQTPDFAVFTNKFPSYIIIIMYEDAFRMRIEGSMADQTIHNGDLPGHGSDVKTSKLGNRLC